MPRPVAQLVEDRADAHRGRDGGSARGAGSPRGPGQSNGGTLGDTNVACGTSPTPSAGPGWRGGTRWRPGHRAADPEAATRAMTVLHSTEPATRLPLASGPGSTASRVADVDRALYDDRTLVKQLAMRRTLFVFPRDLLPGGVGERVGPGGRALGDPAGQGGRGGRASPTTARPGSTEARAAVLDDAAAARRADRAGDPRAGARSWRPGSTCRPGKTYGANVSIAPRVLTQLGVEGALVRGENAGHWRISRPRWTLMSDWLGDVPAPAKADEGYAELVGRWLRSFGPGTEDDLVWWLGGDQGGGPRGAGGARRGRGVARRRRDRLGAARRRRPGAPRSSRGRRCCRCSTRR